MKDLIREEIKKYVLTCKTNWSEEINDYWFDEPITQFALADDPLFEEYKKIIGEYHLTPREAFELTFGKGIIMAERLSALYCPSMKGLERVTVDKKNGHPKNGHCSVPFK